MTTTLELLTDADFARVSKAVYDHCGINLHDGKRELVQARLSKLLRQRPGDTATAFLDRVLDRPDGPEFIELIDAISTNLTSFFREAVHFDYLAQELLPRLLEAKRRAGRRRVRAWCAASSTGEEPYSIAMILQAAMDAAPEGAAGWDALLLATDISTRVLKVAREAVYDRRRAEPVPPALRGRYMADGRQRGTVTPVPAVRRLVTFARLNLMEPWPFGGPLDFIFCRNVMIYFDKPTQQRLIARFHDLLAPGGILFTGHSESLTGVAHRFGYVPPTIYRKA
jgi:chemotaxis protein methyltransferase CheR